MNLEALLIRLDDRHKELTEIRWGVPYGYLKTIKQLKKVEKLISLVDSRIRRKGPILDPVMKHQMTIAYKKWTTNRRFMSLDVERTEAGALHEIGITMVQGRSIETFNYRVRGIERGPQFIFGSSIEADVDIIKNLVMLHAGSADAYIGHDFRHDIAHLLAEGIELPDRFYYDTSKWGKGILGYRPRLYDLTQQFGVGSTQMHCGGNDSRYTAEIFLKMINTYGVS
jgi:hypothetical protein